jgi:hypothetical protein
MHRLTALCLLVLFFSAPIYVCPQTASATSFRLTATAKPGTTGSDFFILYTDVDNDGLFGLEDGDVVDVFSGVSINIGFPFQVNATTVLASPVHDAGVSPLTDGAGLGFNGTDFVPIWVFGDPDFATVPLASDWTYTQSLVPIPSAAYLLGAGLIPLAWFRRRNRLGK